MTENKVHLIDCREGLRAMPEKSANLIICDPPYFRVKGDFDFKMTWDEWLQLHEDLARECRRVIADNGSLFIYGDRRNIAYVQVIFDKWFNFENHIFWQKASKSMVERFQSLRSFPERGFERLLFYSTGMEPGEWDQTGWERVKLDVANFQPLRDYFERLQKWVGVAKKHFIDNVGQCADHCFRWNSSQWDLPTPETYAQLIQVFKIDKWAGFREYEDLRREYEDLRREYEDLRREYEDLRREYEDLRRPFNNFMKLSDHWYFTNGDHSDIEHDTPKPEKMTRAMILTTTRPGDLVVVPFAGSGTECAMAAKERRRFIGFETEQKYVDMANERARPHIERKQLSILDELNIDA